MSLNESISLHTIIFDFFDLICFSWFCARWRREPTIVAKRFAGKVFKDPWGWSLNKKSEVDFCNRFFWRESLLVKGVRLFPKRTWAPPMWSFECLPKSDSPVHHYGRQGARSRNQYNTYAKQARGSISNLNPTRFLPISQFPTKYDPEINTLASSYDKLKRKSRQQQRAKTRPVANTPHSDFECAATTVTSWQFSLSLMQNSGRKSALSLRTRGIAPK